jgi:hypothetical protein
VPSLIKTASIGERIVAEVVGGGIWLGAVIDPGGIGQIHCDEVVDQFAHVPLATGRRRGSLVGPDCRNQIADGSKRARKVCGVGARLRHIE